MPAPRANRFTVSLPASLMTTLDRLKGERGYGTRSEFIRDLLRAELVKEEWKDLRGQTLAVLVLVYDHDTRALADKLADIQHRRYQAITSALHVHVDEHTCLEAIALRGTVRQVRAIGDSLLAIKGVRYGQLVPATSGRLT
jgi:CopG family nickel-responsive transcriptional regulator